MTKSIAVECKSIRKSYGSDENRVDALKPTDLKINTGELTLLVGPSGSGKTTLISIIATILTPDEGELALLGYNMNNLTEIEKAKFRSQNIGIVFQSLFLIPTLTVAENVALPLIIEGLEEHKALEKAHDLLDKIHLLSKAKFSPANLSKGQQQRVAIARAMINESSIMICDEPTSSLDHVSGFEIMKFLQELAKNTTKAVLVVTHDPRIFSYADRIIAMSDGEITPGGLKNE